jgi:hypothetical protein
MKKIDQSLSLFQYLCFLIPSVLLLCGLILLFSSCDKEIPGGSPSSGEPFEVRFVLNGNAYGDPAPVRSSATHSMPEETVVIPLKGTLYLYAALEEVPEPATRANVALAEGVKVRVVAYRKSTMTVEGTDEYTVRNGELTPENAGISLSDGEYTFVVYSYNSPTSPPYAERITVAPDMDLLWGSATQRVQASKKEVTIAMEHLFSLITVECSSAQLPNQLTIGDVAAEITPGNEVSLQIANGAITKGATYSQILQGWTGFNSQYVTSAPRTVFTDGAQTTKVVINRITVDGVRFYNITAGFTKTLERGKSYRFYINLKRTVWAGSNIYWSRGKSQLTFAGWNTPVEDQMRQGVFFKWGSLVGISPSWNNGLFGFSSAVPVYLPTPDGSKWEQKAFSHWDDIQYIKKMFPFYGATGKHLYNEPMTRFTGDICKALQGKGAPSGNWRMPTASEMGTKSGDTWSENVDWEKVHGSDFSRWSNTQTDGQSLVKSGGDFHGVRFPASGYRDGNGMLMLSGEGGYYWTSSGFSDSDGYCQMFSASKIHSYYNAPRQGAFPVRCIRNM